MLGRKNSGQKKSLYPIYGFCSEITEFKPGIRLQSAADGFPIIQKERGLQAASAPTYGLQKPQLSPQQVHSL